MKAIRVYEPGGPEKLLYEEVPNPTVAQGEVLVKVAAAGVLHTDILIRQGETHGPGVGLEYPLTPGLEVSGTVAAVADGVDTVRMGQAVVAVTPINGYAEMVAVPSQQVFPAPPGVNLPDAATVPVQGLTAALAVHFRGEAHADEWVLITAAAGGVGTYAVQIAKAVGAKVIAAVGSEEKTALVRQLGADEVFVYRGDAWQGNVRRVTNGRGVDLVVDSVGGDVLEGCLNVLAFMGRVVAFGTAGGRQGTVNMERLIGQNQEIKGFTLGSQMQKAASRQAIEDFMRWLAQRKVRPIIGDRLPLSEAAELHRRIEARATTGNQILLIENQS